MDELQHIIEQKQALLAREEVSYPALDYSEGMTAEEQKRYINYLAERVREADLGLRARDLVLQDFLDKQKEYESRLSKLDEVLSRMDFLESELKEKERKLKLSERKVADLTSKLKYADKNRFGDKSQKSKKSKSSKNEKSDRNQDKDDFDGTPSSLPENSIGKGVVEEAPDIAPTEKKRDLSNRPETYNTMGVQNAAKEYKSDLGKVPGRILNRRMVPVFHLEMNLVEERFEMVQYVKKGKKPKWGYFPMAGNLDKFWCNLFAFLKDGNLLIDNNIAERAIRPLTTQRNSMLHFGSDEGAEMAATYHSIISTVKMHGRSAWEYLGKFFTKSLIKRRASSLLECLSVKTLSKIFNGCRDFVSLRPDKIGLAICQ